MNGTLSQSSRSARRLIVLGTYASYLLLVFLWNPSKVFGSAWLAVVAPLGLLTLLGYTLITVFQIGLLSPQPGGPLVSRLLLAAQRGGTVCVPLRLHRSG